MLVWQFFCIDEEGDREGKKKEAERVFEGEGVGREQQVAGPSPLRTQSLRNNNNTALQLSVCKLPVG